MMKRKMVKTSMGVLLSLALLSVSMNGGNVSAACKHSYIGVYNSTTIRARMTHECYNRKSGIWEKCTRKDVVVNYVYKCEKCGAYSGGGYCEEYFAHTNEESCPFYPRETADNHM